MNTRPWVRVSALHEGRLAHDLAALQPTHVISLVDPTLAPQQLPRFDPGLQVFQRRIFDVEHDVRDGPAHQVIGELIEFLQAWAPVAAGSRLLTHCHMGVSRSTAAAYLALAVHAGSGREAVAFADFLLVANKPWPNRRIVALADEILGRNGALVAPLEAYRRAHPRRPEAYGRLHTRRALFN